jgi:flavorubredoxin
MKTLQLTENLFYVGVVDHGLEVFDVVMPTKYGTTYNSYLLKTEEGGVLFEGSKGVFEDEYLENIAFIMPFSEIKYIVVAHSEPDHSGAIEKLLLSNPEITVLASASGLNNLKNIIRKPFKSQAIMAGKEMKVGQYTFQFVSGLFLHWPDVIFTYIKELKALVSCDAFGAHYATDDILLSKEKDMDSYHDAFKYYFDAIMAPFASFAIQACDRVSVLDLEWILTGHGPVIDTKVSETIRNFRALAEANKIINDKEKVTIVYGSCYGYTKQMANHLKERFEADGKKVSFYEINALNYAELKDKILEDIQTSGKVLFGSPTVINDAIPLFYDLLLAKPNTFFQGKIGSVFGDYGWSGEAVANLSSFMKMKKMTVVDGFKYSFKIDEEGFKALDTYYDSIK